MWSWNVHMPCYNEWTSRCSGYRRYRYWFWSRTNDIVCKNLVILNSDDFYCIRRHCLLLHLNTIIRAGDGHILFTLWQLLHPIILHCDFLFWCLLQAWFNLNKSFQVGTSVTTKLLRSIWHGESWPDLELYSPESNRLTLEVLGITWHPLIMISYRVNQSSFLRKFMLVCTRSIGWSVCQAYRPSNQLKAWMCHQFGRSLIDKILNSR